MASLLGAAPPASSPAPIEPVPFDAPASVGPGDDAQPVEPATAQPVEPAPNPVTQTQPGIEPAPSEPVASAPDEPDPNKRLSVEYRPNLGVLVSSADGRFAMGTWLRMQLRDTLTHNPTTPPNLTNGMEFRRVSLFFAGNVFGPHNQYFLQLVFDPRGLGMQDGQVTQSPVFDFFFTFDYLRDLSLRIGQYKPQYSRQFIAAWADLQFVDRSTVQSEFLLERDLGFDLFSNDLGGLDLFRYSLGLYMGQGRNNLAINDLRMDYVARLEVLPLGGFDEYVEADLERRRKPKLALGAAYSFSDHATRDRSVIGALPADGGTTNIHQIVADGVFKLRGFSATGEFFWRRGTRNPGSAVDDMGVPLPITAPRNGMGWFVQAGYLLPHVPVELAGRGGQTIALGNSSMGSIGELGAGPSWYLQGHAMKLQLDYFHTWSNADFAQGANQVRLQLQIGI
ncbi:hypothetical protein [Enhygromyxa salina]|uniref:hypothetical protein n=1 Tax=Enhygromyxa salina TaxID=215803 RepID=UPI000D03851A|nr:hypothetical protein [Enhygromyxa salina]